MTVFHVGLHFAWNFLSPSLPPSLIYPSISVYIYTYVYLYLPMYLNVSKCHMHNSLQSSSLPLTHLVRPRAALFCLTLLCSLSPRCRKPTLSNLIKKQTKNTGLPFVAFSKQWQVTESISHCERRGWWRAGGTGETTFHVQTGCSGSRPSAVAERRSVRGCTPPAGSRVTSQGERLGSALGRQAATRHAF